MSYNIGPKIGIEGEAEFRQQIRDINTAYKSLQAETKALTAVFEANGDEQGKLQAQSKQLQKEAELQKKKFELLEDAVQKAAKKYGENSTEATRLRGAMYDAQASMVKLETQIRDTDEQLAALANGTDHAADQMDNLGDAADDLDGSLGDANGGALDFKDIMGGNLIADAAMAGLEKAADLLVDFAKGSIDAAADVKAAASQFEQTFGDMSQTAKSSLESISDDTGIAATRMQDSFTKLYAFTKTAGADSAEALDISSRAMVAAADNAAYFDRSIEEVTESLQSFLKGNYENDSALGISATETTRNAKANELYAKSFKELSESQKVDVLLSMVEAGNKASGAIGQAAREADEWTNVMGEAKEAVRLLQAEVGKPILEAAIPIVKSFTDVLKKLVEQKSYEALANDIDAFSASVEKAEERFDSTRESAEATADVAQRYVDRLEELEAGGLKTADAQREYQIVVDQLNTLLPELNLSIDEQTGLVNQNTESIRGNIDALKDQYVEQARQEKYATIMEARADAVVGVEEAEHRLIAAQTERKALDEQMEDLSTRLNAVHSESAEIGGRMGSSYAAAAQGAAGLNDRQKELDAEAADLGAQFLRLQEQVNANQKEQDLLNQEIEEGRQVIHSYDEELDQSTAAAKEHSDGQAELAQKVRDTQAEIDLLTQGYMDAKQANLDSINSQIGLFQELATESEMSAQEIVDNWYAQKEAFDNYTVNMQKAVDMGLDQVLVDQLCDGSEEGMLVLDELVNSTEVDIDEINAAFGQRMQAEEKMAETMGGVQKAYDDGIANLKEKAYQDGVYFAEGVAQGIRDNTGCVAGAAADMGYAGTDAFESAVCISSPSKVMRRDGQYIGEGAILGIQDMIDEYERVNKKFAESGESAFAAHQVDLAQNVANYSTVASTSNVTTNTKTYGDIYLSVYEQPGEDTDALTTKIMEAIEFETQKKGGVLYV